VPDALGNDVALDTIQALLEELAAIFPDNFFHLGGDEVDQKCWQHTPSVQAWMASVGYNSTDQVYEYFVSHVDAMAIALDRSPIRWEEVWEHFGGQPRQRATSQVYRAIWSVNEEYYLDHTELTWKDFDDVDVLAGITNSSAVPFLLAGEMEMWGEEADGSDVLQTIWPRAAAAAERLWAYDHVTTSADPSVLPRLQQHRCAGPAGRKFGSTPSSERAW
jgi:hexosaminidase